MNVHAAHAHHIPWHYGARDIEVTRGQSATQRRHTEIHERVEAPLMAHGWGYKPAHKVALAAERADENFKGRGSERSRVYAEKGVKGFTKQGTIRKR